MLAKLRTPIGCLLMGLLLYNPPALAEGNVWSKYSADGLQAEMSQKYSIAESNYGKALEEAKRTHSNHRQLDTLTNLIGLKREEQKIREAEPFFQQALNLARTPGSDDLSEGDKSVFMEAISDSYNQAGENTNNEKTKEYCLQHYIDSRILKSNKYDENLITKINTLETSCLMQGRYSEAELLQQTSLKIINRDSAKVALPMWLYQNGAIFLAQKKYSQAEACYTTILNSAKQPMDNQFGLVQMLEGNFERANTLYLGALKHDEQCGGNIGFDKYCLGIIQERLKHTDLAIKYFNESLSLYKGGKYGSPDRIVMVLEHLARNLQLQGKRQMAHNLEIQANTIRAQHPEWTKVSNPDTETFFLIWSMLPFPIEIIPTRISIAF
jgi:tetratricopeptide (TPR) repeat protein